MMLIFVLCLLFISFFFYFLAKKHKKSIVLNLLLGSTFFIVAYYVINFVLEFFLIGFLKFNHFNQIVIDCFSIPFALMVSAILYKYIEKQYNVNN